MGEEVRNVLAVADWSRLDVGTPKVDSSCERSLLGRSVFADLATLALLLAGLCILRIGNLQRHAGPRRPRGNAEPRQKFKRLPSRRTRSLASGP